MPLLSDYRSLHGYDPETLIQVICEDLRKICHSSEDQFMQLGQRLQQFSMETQDLSEQCNAVAGIISGEDVQATMQANSEKMKRMQLLITEIKIDFDWTHDVLKHLIARIYDVRQPLEGFGRQILLLHNLGVSTRTSIAELGDEGLEFSSLADALSSMAKNVGEHSKDILARMDPLHHAAKDAQSTLNHLQAGSYEHLASSIENIITHFEQFVSRREEFEQSGRNLASYFNEISTSIMDIVVSLQFHDILRQSLEHVCESLEELCTNTEQGKRRKRWNFSQIAAVCELQIGQVKQAYTEFKSAVDSALTNLSRMAASTEKMILEVNAMEEVQQELSSLVKGLGSEMELVEQYGRANAELVTRMNSVKDSVSSIYESIVFMGNIEHEMRLIGLNSTIKAVLIGDRGAALVTLSGEIQRCAAEISQNGRTVSDVLKQIVERFEVLAESRSGKDEILLEISNEFKAESASMEQINDKMSTPMEALKESGQELPNALQAAATDKTLHHDADQHAEHALSQLQALLESTRQMEERFGRKSHKTAAAHHIHDLINKYTVHSERQTHYDLIDKTAPPELVPVDLETEKHAQLDTADTEIQLWDDPVFADLETTISAGPPSQQELPDEEDVLDDNIELF